MNGVKEGSSNIARYPDRQAIQEEAAEWTVRLDRKELSESEVCALRQWIMQSDYHRSSLEDTAKAWDSMAALGELAELFPLPDKETSSGSCSKSAFLRFLTPSYRFVLSSLVVVGLTMLTVTFFSDRVAQKYVTSIGERATWQLADGSTLTLNTNSEAEVDFTGELRAVRLLSGEGSFDVAKDASRPFVVLVGTGMVRVIGTAFNVRYSPDKTVDVIVTEGRVSVVAEVDQSARLSALDIGALSQKPPTDSAQLEAVADAGQRVVFHKVIHQVRLAEVSELEKSLAWKEGGLVFSGEPLEQALREVERYTSKRLVITDPSIRNISVGGYYKVNDIDGMLAALGKGLGLQVQEVIEGQVHFSKSKSGAGQGSPE